MKIVFHGGNAANFRRGFAGMLQGRHEISGRSTLLPIAAKKRSFCQTQFQKCVAQCKRGDTSNADACVSICVSDEWWCSAFCPFQPLLNRASIRCA